MAILVGAFGSLIGSFLNVVVFRVPEGRSIISPPSACGSCGARIRPWDNVPVISWIALRGRCRDCGAAISVRYPLVELGTALLFVAVALRFGSGIFGTAVVHPVAGLLVLLAFLYLAAISIALALIDLDVQKLPNAIVAPAYLVGLVLLAPSALLGGEVARLVPAAIGAAALFALYLALALIRPGGMGFGDVKLAGVLGLFLGYLGWGSLAVGALSAFVLGGLFGAALLLARRAGRTSRIPFGPWMIAGAWVGIFFGAPIAVAYLSLFGLGG